MQLDVRSQPSDVIRQLPFGRANPLDFIFTPKTIAIIGASEKRGSVGNALAHNIDRKRFRVFAVNPNHSTILGEQAYPTIGSVPEQIDLAVIATPATAVPEIIRECVDAGVKGAIIISAGFRECGPSGAALESSIRALARGKLRIIGPNCLGAMVPRIGLNATFSNAMALPGNVGFLSQSGALCTAILDWSLREQVGFSAFVSTGSMIDVDWGDLITYLGDDPFTKSIVIYMESVGNARSFLSAAREVALSKPIIVLKVGRTASGAKAAASHTGSMTGSDEVFDAALRRVGVLRVQTIEELFDMAEILGKQPRPRGPRLAIVTNAGGPGALAADMLVSGSGELAQLSQNTLEPLNKLLPAHWSHGNPVDILGDADATRYAKATELLIKEPNADGVLVILTPQAMTDAAGTAEKLKLLPNHDGKPLLACWMGGESIEAGRRVLNAAGICTFDYPDTAAQSFDYMWQYTQNLRGIYQTPSLGPLSAERESVRNEVYKIISAARKSRRTVLTEFESKKILEAYGIPTTETRVALTKEEAVKIAHQLGYPVVLKLYSETLTHKTDVGGVQLNLKSEASVRHAWDSIETSVREKAGNEHFLGVTVQPMIKAEGCELIIGSSIDPQFGPVLLFGLGGQFVEFFQDRALALPPLNSTLARRMMERTRVYEVLKGVRGKKPVDLSALEQLLVRFSHLVVEQRWIAEIDINPLLGSPERLVALDARIVLHGPDVTEKQLPKLAIRSYPSQYVIHWKTRTGESVTIRPIRPEDEPLMVKFHQTLSEESVYYRYFSALKLPERIAHERLTRICFNDYDREIALVAERHNEDGEREILSVGRLSKIHGLAEAEFAIIVSDTWQNQGLGTEFLKLLIRIARDEKLDRLTAHILPENRGMQSICRKLGFELRHETSSSEYFAETKL